MSETFAPFAGTPGSRPLAPRAGTREGTSSPFPAPFCSGSSESTEKPASTK